jgi:hypothetical protein
LLGPTFVISIGLAFAAVFAFGASGAATATPNAASTRPTIVLVHGDWADGSSWTSVIERLQRKDFTVVAPPNLLRGPVTDAPYLASYLKSIPGPIVLVAPARVQLGLGCRERSRTPVSGIRSQLGRSREERGHGRDAAATLRPVGRALQLAGDSLVQAGRRVSAMPCSTIGILLRIRRLGQRAMCLPPVRRRRRPIDRRAHQRMSRREEVPEARGGSRASRRGSSRGPRQDGALGLRDRHGSPASRSFSTSFEPIRPLPPITTIFISFPFRLIARWRRAVVCEEGRAAGVLGESIEPALGASDGQRAYGSL